MLVLLTRLKHMDLTVVANLSGKELGKIADMAAHLEHDVAAVGECGQPLHRFAFAVSPVEPVPFVCIAAQMEWQTREGVCHGDGPVALAQKRQRNGAQKSVCGKPFTEGAESRVGQEWLHGGCSSGYVSAEF